MAGTRPEPADVQVALRLPRSMVDRIDTMAALLANSPKVTVLGRATRSSVVKLAIERGLESLEKEHR